MGNSDKQLIAPCGMYCGMCSAYLACLHQVPRQRGKFTYCAGCRARNKQCAWLKKRCKQLRSNAVQYCHQCLSYPCRRLEHIAERYRTKYGMDFRENLALVRDGGEQALLKALEERYSCERCGGLRSIHSGKCFECDEIRSWKE